MMDDLPADRELSSVKVFTSADSSLALNIFSYMQKKVDGGTARSTQADIKGADHIFALAARVQAGKDDRDESSLLRGPHPAFELDSLRAFMRGCAPELVANSGPRSFLIKKRLHDSVAGYEDVAIHAEPWRDADVDAAAFTSITMAVPNVMTQKMLRRTVGYLGALPVAVTSDCGTSVQRKTLEKLDIYRLHVDTTRGSQGNERMALFRILVRRWSPAEHGPAADGRATPALAAEPWTPRLAEATKADSSLPAGRAPSHDGEMSGLGRDRWAIIQQDLRRLKWLNERTLQLAAAQTSLGLERAEIIDALCSMMHSTLSSPEGWAMTKTHMWQAATCCDALPLSAAAAQLFIERFDPAHPLEDGEFTRRLSSLRQRVAEDLEQEASVVVLTAMLDAVSAALRTNLFLKDRFALAIRMDPSVFRRRFADPTRSPFGVIFVHGDCFSGFHVRFRDISRGGLRIVTPHADEQLGVESARLFQEAYNLAFAQQLKNKDIPEGGGKAVVLVDEVSFHLPEHRDLAIRNAVKAFSNSVLDLISTHELDRSRMVDYFKRPELIYLGPDEQIIPEDIVWIVKRAAERHYPIPSAFMSSKPDAGINHKVYGVTSEGVQVFLDQLLKYAGRNPRTRPFTVKITGGPDGDVAGNAIKILHREYGDNVKIVGIADGSGYAEDPQGLHMPELLRLVEASAPIAAFDPSLLSVEGVLTPADTLQRSKLRNSMHMRVVTDAFLPAGGRPSTINASNWRSYLLPNGTPSSPLIVEGANLFISPEARSHLAEAGVAIVKDSSANKCGVICSSYEILASMALSTEEFLALKTEFVTDVLVRLRELARREAQLLFRESTASAVPLHEICATIGETFDAVKGAIADEIEAEVEANNNVLPELFYDALSMHLPAIFTQPEYFQRVLTRVPTAYLIRMAATSLTSMMLYDEGLQVAQNVPAKGLLRFALSYTAARSEAEMLSTKLTSGAALESDEAQKLARYMAAGGARAILTTAMRDAGQA